MVCHTESAAPNDEHELWVERDSAEGVITFDCSKCDYWRIVQGHPTIEQLTTMQCVAVHELNERRCQT